VTSPPPDDEAPLRVSTLELFFDLVFVFTITQLTSLIAHDAVTPAGALRALLVFGVLWWIYGGYVWLTNTRTPSRTPERVLLLLGMAGFLIIGMAIPDAFSRRVDGVALGLGYLLVVAVHGGLYLRVNRSIVRVLPVNGGAAVLVIVAGIAEGRAAYWLWAAALALLVIAPFVIAPQTHFRIAPAHFVERHSSVIIIALGESVADIGLSADNQRLTASLVISAVLGLALAALLWWTYFGVGDDERAEQAFTRAADPERSQLALDAYFYSYIPMLLGIVVLAAGIKEAMQHPGTTLPYRPCLALAGGVALFLAGDVLFRRALGIAPLRFRAAGAAACLALWITGVAVSSAAEIALLALVLAGALILERRVILERQVKDGPGSVEA
jgi:low temperature requirement protein LtrA